MVNGQWQEHAESPSVSRLLEGLSLDPRRVAIELNRQILPRARYAQTNLKDNDQLEIVTLVGGG
jgi:sulfur carrier protein